MLNVGASKPRARGGARAPGAPPLDPHLSDISGRYISKTINMCFTAGLVMFLCARTGCGTIHP